MEIPLPDEITHFIHQEVACGDFGSPEEVVQEGLRLLQAHRQQWQAEIREKIEVGIRQLDEGHFVTAEQFRDSMEDFKRRWKAEHDLK